MALGREGTPEFYESLAEALWKEPAGGTVANLVWRYKQSTEFASLRDRTRSDYAVQLDKIQGKFGELSLRAMAARQIAQHIYSWRDSMAKSPRRADYALQMLKALLAWGVRRGLLEQNRAVGIGHLYKADRRENTWTDDHVAAFVNSAPEPLKRALVLALETGQSQGDLLALGWSAINGPIIDGRRKKTDIPVAIPISPLLQECLAASPPRGATTILTKADGLPWDPKGNGFRAAWRDAARKAGIRDVTFNDLRGTFITRRRQAGRPAGRQAGWTEEKVALCSGHPMAKRGAFHAYVDRAAVARANALRLAKQYYEAVA